MFWNSGNLGGSNLNTYEIPIFSNGLSHAQFY